jgi:hypothetical protein
MPDEWSRWSWSNHGRRSKKLQAFCELWESWADRCRPEMDDAVHAAALSGLKDQLAHDGDEGGAHAAEVCERDLVARLGFNGVPSSTPRRRQRALPCARSRPTARQRGHAPAPGCGWGWQPVGARTGDGRRATLHALLLVLGLSLFCPDPRNPYFVLCLPPDRRAPGPRLTSGATEPHG